MMTDEELDCMEALTNEVTVLRERVRALERAQEIPDNAFWGQLMFDVFVFAWVVCTIVWHFGG